MKVLWTVNLIPSTLAVELGLQKEVLGGWVEAMAEQLKNTPDFELAIACKCENLTFSKIVNGIRYYSLSYGAKNAYESLLSQCEAIIDDFKPDIIHIEGTEFIHAKAAITTGKSKGIPVVASMQGILNGQYNYQCGQLPIEDMLLSGKATEVFASTIMYLRKKLWYKPRLKAEKEIIESVDYILGRTTWDRAHSYALNPNAKYFSCNRILREPFYNTRWDIEKMEHHSIYVGNGYYPLKGLHYLVMAIPLLVREYPDLKVYVAGYKPYEENDKRSFYKKGYSAYLKKLIKDNNAEKFITFTGPLSAQQVAEKLATVNAYVLTSAIENSPNTLGEAMLVGTPCIASYVGGVPDMATDGVDALFYRNDDYKLLAWKIKYVFDNPDFSCIISANAQTKAKENHSTEKNVSMLLHCYNEILRDK